MKLLEHDRYYEAALAGNKAAMLARLAKAGFNVPAFIVVRCDSQVAEHCPVTATESILAAVDSLAGATGTFAVRSSSVEEDGDATSFAGMFESYLGVTRGDVVARIDDVVASADSSRVVAYRRNRNLAAPATRPAVLVQKMVDADVAGVAFAANPATGNPDEAVVAAVRGLGDRLVDGAEQGDTWHVDTGNDVVAAEIAGSQAVLNAGQLQEVVDLVREVSRFAGSPQDIEWAIAGDELYLLQSRNITTCANPTEDYTERLWDNSNIVESYGGVTTPLTFSVARSAYAAAYRHLGRSIGVSERTIAAHSRTYEQMIGLIRGRVYYNLVNWYRLLMLVPGFRHNRRFMEQMMGVTRDLPASALSREDREASGNRLLALAGAVRVGVKLLGASVGHRRAVVRFHRRIDALLPDFDPASMSLEALVDEFERLQSAAIGAWHTPLINDLLCMISHGALRKLCSRWLPGELQECHNALVSGGSDIISMEPIRLMNELAAICREDAVLARCLRDGSRESIEQAIAERPRFRRVYADYLARFGDRCLDELKLESKTLTDNPLPFLRNIAALAAEPPVAANGTSGSHKTEQSVRRNFAARPVKRFLFERVLRIARGRMADRENMRFERTRVYGRVRRIFREIGLRFVRLELLQHADDVFYLTAEEIVAAVRGTGVGADCRALAVTRRAEFDACRAEPAPPRRFLTVGIPQRQASLRILPGDTSAATGDVRSGQGCAEGVVRGTVRVVTDPHQATVQPGDILVAERTDPGWVTLFPLVAGMIMERGSLLSHSAIVARELGIPTVVGVEDAVSWLQDGEQVEIDGAAGIVRRIAERAVA